MTDTAGTVSKTKLRVAARASSSSVSCGAEQLPGMLALLTPGQDRLAWDNAV